MKKLNPLEHCANPIRVEVDGIVETKVCYEPVTLETFTLGAVYGAVDRVRPLLHVRATCGLDMPHSLVYTVEDLEAEGIMLPEDLAVAA